MFPEISSMSNTMKYYDTKIWDISEQEWGGVHAQLALPWITYYCLLRTVLAEIHNNVNCKILEVSLLSSKLG